MSQALNRGSGEPQSSGLQQSSAIFKMKLSFIALKMSHNIAKFMMYIINQSSGDFQQGSCLYKPTSGIQWKLKHS